MDEAPHHKLEHGIALRDTAIRPANPTELLSSLDMPRANISHIVTS